MRKTGLRIGVAALAALLLGASVPARGQQATVETGPIDQLAHADALLKEGKPDQALDLLKQLAAQHPGMTGLDARIGAIYYEKRGYLDAVVHLKKSTEDNPKDD